MKTAKFVVPAGLLIMASVVVWAMVTGDFRGEGAAIWSMPWGRVTLLDLYLGFGLFSGWVVFREGARSTSVIWIVTVMLPGNLAAMVYVLIALKRSEGSWAHFWMGSGATHG